MALHRSVLKEDDILCNTQIHVLMSENSDNEILDSDSDVLTTSSRKQLQLSAIVFNSDSETSTEEEQSSEPESSDDKTSDVWITTDKKPSHEHFLGSTGLNIISENLESVVEVTSSITGDNVIQLLTAQANLYHSQNAGKREVPPKTLKWSNITPEEIRKFWVD